MRGAQHHGSLRSLGSGPGRMSRRRESRPRSRSSRSFSVRRYWRSRLVACRVASHPGTVVTSPLRLVRSRAASEAGFSICGARGSTGCAPLRCRGDREPSGGGVRSAFGRVRRRVTPETSRRFPCVPVTGAGTSVAQHVRQGSRGRDERARRCRIVRDDRRGRPHARNSVPTGSSTGPSASMARCRSRIHVPWSTDAFSPLA